MLQDLLKKYLNDDAKVNEFVEEMKKEKIFTSAEENMDIRYPKLKSDYEALLSKDEQSQKLIDELKKSNGNNEGLQAKIGEYESKIVELQKQNETLVIDNAIKVGLLAKGAKANDIDYLIYRIKQSDNEFRLDKEGNVKGLDSLIDDVAKTYSGNFEDKTKKKVDVKDLPKGDDDNNTITKEMFGKMGYKERAKLYQDNKELYDELSKGE